MKNTQMSSDWLRVEWFKMNSKPCICKNAVSQLNVALFKQFCSSLIFIFRLSRLFRLVPMGPDNRGLTVLYFFKLKVYPVLPSNGHKTERWSVRGFTRAGMRRKKAFQMECNVLLKK